MQIVGRLINIIDCGIVGENKTPKKQCIVNDDINKETICIDFLGENVAKLSELSMGDTVICQFKSAINMGTAGAVFNRISGNNITKVDE